MRLRSGTRSRKYIPRMEPPTLVIARYGAPSGVSTRFAQVTARLFLALPTASICTERSIVLVVHAFSFDAGATFESTG